MINFLNYIDEYSNSIYRQIKIKPVYAKRDTEINFDIESVTQKAKFKVGDHAGVSKYKNIFGENHQQNGIRKCL